MADPICPAGTVLIKPAGAVHPDEPAFCIGKTEVPQKPFMEFLRKNFESAYDKITNLLEKKYVKKGDKKPAVFAKWGEAQAYCKAAYPGGDLPTERQWENACGKGEYCTGSETLNHTEVIYDDDGTADVDGPSADKRVNKQGVQDLTGNVWEWTRNVDENGRSVVRGGSWFDFVDDLSAAIRVYSNSNGRNYIIGFRCVAP